MVTGIEGTEIPPITRDHYRKAGLKVSSAYPVPPGLSHMTTGFDPRADLHTSHTAGSGGFADFLGFEFCGFHDLHLSDLVEVRAIEGTDRQCLRLSILPGELSSSPLRECSSWQVAPAMQFRQKL